MHYQEALFKFISKYFLIRNSSFYKNGKTKVYALEDSLGRFAQRKNYSLNSHTQIGPDVKVFFFYQTLD